MFRRLPLSQTLLAYLMVGTALLSVAGSSSAQSAPSTKPTPPLELEWVLPSGDLPGSGATTNVVLRLTTQQPLESLRIEFDQDGAVRPAKAGWTIGGTLVPGHPREISVPVELLGGGEGRIMARVFFRVTGQPWNGMRARELFFDVRTRRTVAAPDAAYWLHRKLLKQKFRSGPAGPNQQRELRGMLHGAIAPSTIIQGRRLDGKPLDTPDTDSQLQAEASGGDSASRAPAGNITISGFINWQDSTGQWHPCRQIDVMIIDLDMPFSADDTLSTVRTDDNGHYSATVANQVFDNIDVVIVPLARGPGFAIVDVGQRNDPWSANQATWWVKSAANHNDLTADALISMNLRNNLGDAYNAFSVCDGILETFRYGALLHGSTLPNLPVEFPGPGTASFFSSTGGNHLSILRLDRYDWDVTHHETGHYLAQLHHLDNSPGGTHSSRENLSERLGKDQGTRLAWSEGWATYYGISGQQQQGTSARGVPKAGDTFYDDTEDASLHYDMESLAGRIPLGEDNEASVARALFDVFDGPNETRDQVGIGAIGLFNKIKTLSPQRVEDAWTAFTTGQPVQTLVLYGDTFAVQKISPEPTAPVSGLEIQPSTIPTFTWDPNVGGPSFRGNQFRIEFWSSDWATQRLQIDNLTSATFTPTLAQHRQIFAGAGPVHWFVRANNTGTPATGFYASPDRLVRMAGVDVAFVIDDTGSMGEEIAGVRDALLAHLAHYDPASGTVFQLVTFKDVATPRAPTSDLAEIEIEVAGLSAGGGNDCPEGSVESLLGIYPGLKPGARVLLATDASPHPGVDLGAAINALRALGARVDVILSGDCTTVAAEPALTICPDCQRQGRPTVQRSAPKEWSLRAPSSTVFIPRSIGAVDTLLLGDDTFQQVLLPFAFSFSDTTWTSIFVNSNGVMTFRSGTTTYNPATPADLMSQPLIAPAWRDLAPHRGGLISVSTVDTTTFRISFDAVPQYSSTLTISFDLDLHPDGHFEIHYGSSAITDPLVAVSVSGNVPDSGSSDLSLLASPIDVVSGLLYEQFGSINLFDLSNSTLAFNPVTVGQPPFPPTYSAIEGFSLLSSLTGGLFAFVPDVNTSVVGASQYQNTIFNIVQGGLSGAISMVDPQLVYSGGRTWVTLTGSGTNFRSNTLLDFSDPGIVVENQIVRSPIRIEALVNVASAVLPDRFYDVVATTDLGGGTVETATGSGAFRVITGMALPVVTGISPTIVGRGDSLRVQISGMNAQFADSSQVNMGAGVTVLSVHALAPDLLTAVIQVATNATVGFRSITITTGSQTANENLYGPLFVSGEAPSAPAVLTSIQSSHALPGQTKIVTISGVNTHFVSGTSVLSFSSSGITVDALTVASSTAMIATITVDSTATLGYRDVRIVTGAETAVLLSGFLVTTQVCAAPPAEFSVSLEVIDEGTRQLLVLNQGQGSAYDIRIAAAGTSVIVGDLRPSSESAVPELADQVADGMIVELTWIDSCGGEHLQRIEVAASTMLPARWELLPARPNPFNPRTTIRFDLPRSAQVELTVLDGRGRRVRTLVSTSLPAGRHAVIWNGTDEANRSVSSGVYYYRLLADGFVRIGKMALVR